MSLYRRGGKNNSNNNTNDNHAPTTHSTPIQPLKQLPSIQRSIALPSNLGSPPVIDLSNDQQQTAPVSQGPSGITRNTANVVDHKLTTQSRDFTGLPQNNPQQLQRSQQQLHHNYPHQQLQQPSNNPTTLLTYATLRDHLTSTTKKTAILVHPRFQANPVNFKDMQAIFKECQLNITVHHLDQRYTHQFTTTETQRDTPGNEHNVINQTPNFLNHRCFFDVEFSPRSAGIVIHSDDYHQAKNNPRWLSDKLRPFVEYTMYQFKFLFFFIHPNDVDNNSQHVEQMLRELNLISITNKLRLIPTWGIKETARYIEAISLIEFLTHNGTSHGDIYDIIRKGTSAKKAAQVILSTNSGTTKITSKSVRHVTEQALSIIPSFSTTIITNILDYFNTPREIAAQLDQLTKVTLVGPQRAAAVNNLFKCSFDDVAQFQRNKRFRQ